MPNQPQNNNNETEIELILDFHSLVSSSCIENGYLCIDYQVESDINNPTLEYCLRNAIRKLGYKITAKKYYGDRMVDFTTNIPEQVAKQYTEIWNEYHMCEEVE